MRNDVIGFRRLPEALTFWQLRETVVDATEAVYVAQFLINYMGKLQELSFTFENTPAKNFKTSSHRIQAIPLLIFFFGGGGKID